MICRCRRRREIADAFVSCRYVAQPGYSLADAGPFVVEKEEKAIPGDRTAQVCAELVLDVLRLCKSCSIVKEAVGVKDAVAQELIGCAVKGVRTALGGDADERAGAAPVLCRIRVGAYLELLNGID